MYMAHLLYFLNPQVDITPLRLAAVTLVYGGICGLIFGSALWLLRWLRVRLFGKPAVMPHLLGIMAGSLDDPSSHRPAIDIYTTSAQPWDYLNPELPKFPKGPPR